MSDHVAPTEPDVTGAEHGDPEPEPDDAAEAESEPSSERGFWGLVAKLTALVVLISAVVGLVVQLWPESTPPPPTKDADMTLDVDSGLTFREYLVLVGQKPGGLSDDVLRRKGARLRFNVTATGYQGNDLTIKWRVLDGVHPTPVESDAIVITPSAEEDTLVPDAFAPFPPRGNRFTLEADVVAPDGAAIEHAEKRFRRQ